jgi:cell division protein FtsB
VARRKRKTNLPTSNFFKKVKKRSVQKKRIIIKILIALAAIFLIYRFFAGPYGFIQIHSLWKQKQSLEKQSKMLDAEMVDLELEKKRLTHDEFYIEKQARERLGMVKEGEKVYRVVQEDKSKLILPDTSIQPTPPDSLSP